MTLLESNIVFTKQKSFGDHVSTFIGKLKA